tara:strand:+ start:2008 stop:2982 length:975 start_codon:yes stop_codon:yes gene_type:complete
MAQVLDSYGKMQTKKLVVQSEVDFQTSDDYKVTLKSANQTANRILTIPALSGNAFALSSESNLNPANLTINSLVGESSPVDADEIIIRDASASANKKVALSHLKTYIGSLPSGTNGQVIVYDGSNDAQAVAMSGDASIVASGALTIADNAITSGKISNSAVTGEKIADDGVSAAKIAANAVTSAKIANDAVAAAKIAANAVTSAKIANDAVSADKIASNAVTSAKIQDDAVATAKIADDAVTNAKIAAAPSSAGTAEASKFALLDANKDLTSIRNLTGTGAFQAAEINIGASGWRFRLNSGNLELQYYDSGSSAFVTKQVFTAS